MSVYRCEPYELWHADSSFIESMFDEYDEGIETFRYSVWKERGEYYWLDHNVNVFDPPLRFDSIGKLQEFLRGGCKLN
jgi:hypothetical protein